MSNPDAPNPDAAAVLRAVAAAVRDIDVSETEAWDDLDALSSNTHVDAVEVFADEIKLRADGFEGLVNVHCTLNYGNDKDGLTLSETFPGRFEGTLSPEGPIIRRLTVDTSGFYA
ncbi:hypothetical protein [Methylobacterium durans]|uniref:Predicted pPIWI-associating nuclease group 2 domain-containing protein n=1 Tax=Methylobacterium durans TaxID=2202825 RepID=A0A2U8W8P5_9HYPH|nr:hypothetical protein [Methylobacterium durans]AWN42504.1 hypothetical protein DK389_20875 [Methylobacterium durans]